MQVVVQLFMVGVLGRLLAPAEFGIASVALAVIGVSSIVAELGIAPALIQRHQLSTADIRTGSTLILVLGTGLTVAMWFVAPFVSSLMLMPQLTPVLRAIGVIFFVRALGAAPEALLLRDGGFRTLSLIQLASFVIVYPAVALPLAFAGYGVWALIGAYLAQAAWTSAVVNVLRKQPLNPRLDITSAARLLKFGWPYSLGRIFSSIASEADKFVAGRLLGATELGFYSRAYQLGSMPASTAGQVIDRVLFPHLSRLQSSSPALRTAFGMYTSASALVLMPVSVVGVLFTSELVMVILGAGWTAVVQPMQVLMSGMYFRVGFRISDSYAKARGAVRGRAWRNAVFAVLIVALVYVGSIWGTIGVAGGVTVAVMLNFLLATHQTVRLGGTTWNEVFRIHSWAAFLSVIIGSTMYLMRSMLYAVFESQLLILVIGAMIALAVFIIVVIVVIKNGWFRQWNPQLANLVDRLIAKLWLPSR